VLFPLAILVSLGSLVCWIIVLVKIFQAGNIGMGIVGIICPLVAFIYGWMKADEYKIKNIMLIWTVLVIASIGLNVAMPRPQFHTTTP
jgi:hypothetical protein